MVYSYLLSVLREKKKGFLFLLDPDRVRPQEVRKTVEAINHSGVDAILLGTSMLFNFDLDKVAKEIKKYTKVPVILFPGSAYQLSPDVDAIFFLSLISGRNPELLIGEQVRAAPLIRKYGIEAIPVGYMLIESTNLTSARFMSNSVPIPRDKPDIAKAHALAGEYLGMKVIYVDAGSGAGASVSEEMISAIKSVTTVPLVVGGGIRTPEEARDKVQAGADFVVVGNALEKDMSVLQEFCRAIGKPV
jgi:phosphoglycerol geranylgeranyltransferase